MVLNAGLKAIESILQDYRDRTAEHFQQVASSTNLSDTFADYGAYLEKTLSAEQSMLKFCTPPGSTFYRKLTATCIEHPPATDMNDCGIDLASKALGTMNEQIFDNTFEVAGHFQISGRGVVILGYVCSGLFKAGMKVPLCSEQQSLTISSVELADNIRERKLWVGLLFKNHPGVEVIRANFPIGSFLHAY